MSAAPHRTAPLEYSERTYIAVTEYEDRLRPRSQAVPLVRPGTTFIHEPSTSKWRRMLATVIPSTDALSKFRNHPGNRA